MTILKSIPIKIAPADVRSSARDNIKIVQDDQVQSSATKCVWAKANDSLISEIAEIKSALESISRRPRGLNESEHFALMEVVQLHAQHITNHIHHLHNHFISQLKMRMKFPEKLETNCDEIIEKATLLRDMASNLALGSKVHELFDAWVSYEVSVTSHLQEEQELALPLRRCFFSDDEIIEMERSFLLQATYLEIGSLIHFMGVTEFHQVFVKQRGISPYTWYFDLRRKYNFFLTCFVTKIDLLQCGTKPKSRWNVLCLFDDVSATLAAISPLLDDMI